MFEGVGLSKNQKGVGLSKNQIGVGLCHWFVYLVAAMKFNENLQELWLGSNHLGPEDGQHLGSILRTNHTLRILDVRDNNLQDAGVRYICAGIAEQIEGLQTLNLTSNNIGHEGFHHISAMLV